MIPTYTRSACRLSARTGHLLASTLFFICLFSGLPAKAAFPGLGTSAGSEAFLDDGSSAITLLNQWRQLTFQPQISADELAAGQVVDCFQAFTAGPDTTYCQGETATLDGGYTTYTGSGIFGLTWTIVQGGGQLCRDGIFCSSFGPGATTNATNFATSFNGLSSPVVTYLPASTDTEVILELRTVSTDGSCDLEIETVTLFYDPFQEAAIDAFVENVEVLDSVGSGTANLVTICEGEELDLAIVNNMALENGQQFGDLFKFDVTVAAGNVTGLPASFVSETGVFNTNFSDLNIGLTVAAGNVETATVSVVTFYDRNGNDVNDGGEECPGPPVEIEIQVRKQAQATSGIQGGNPNFCEGETATIIITGSANSTITYNIDLGDGSGPGADQTTTIPPSGTNTAVTINTAGLAGNTITFALVEVRYNTGAACPRSLSETEILNVLTPPTGSISLTDAPDNSFCNGDSTDMSLSYTTSDPDGMYRLYLSRDVDFVGFGFLDSFDVTTVGGEADFLAALGASTSDGTNTRFRLDSIRGLSTSPNCTATVTSNIVSVQEQAEAFIIFDAAFDNGLPIQVDASSPLTTSVCDGTEFDLTFDVANGYGIDAVNTSEEKLQLVVVDPRDLFGLGGSGTYTEDIADLPFDLFSLDDIELDIPNNVFADETVSITATPYFESDGSAGLNTTEECFGDPVEISITILAQVDATMTVDATEICERDRVLVTITSSAEGTARLAENNGGQTTNVTVSTPITGGFQGTFLTPRIFEDNTITFVDFVRSGMPPCETEFNQQISITVEDLPELETFELAQDTLCFGDSTFLNFSASGGNGTGYIYSYSGSSMGMSTVTAMGDTSVSIVPPAPGIIPFVLDSIQNQTGLMCAAEFTDVFDTLYVEFEPQVTISGNLFLQPDIIELSTDGGPFTDSDTICDGETIIFSFLAGAGNPSVSPVTGDSLYFRVEILQDPSGVFGQDTLYISSPEVNDPILPIPFPVTYTNPFQVPIDIEYLVIPFYSDGADFLLDSDNFPTEADSLFNASCMGDSLEFEVVVNPTPNATFGGNQTICAGDSALLDFTGPNNGSVTVQVFSGDDSNLPMGTVDTVFFNATGEGFYNTGGLDSTTIFRVGDITTDTTVNPICTNTNTFDVTVTVVEPPVAEVTSDLNLLICQGETTSIDYVGTANAEVYITADSLNGGMGFDSFMLDSMGMGTYVAGPILDTVSFIIDSVAVGDSVRCVNDTLIRDTVFVDIFIAPTGTLTFDGSVCIDSMPEVIFTAASDTMLSATDSFTVVINGETFTLAAVDTFQISDEGLTQDSTFFLESVMRANFGGMCTDIIDGNIDSVTIVVEDVPNAIVTLSDGVITATVDTSVIYRDTVCSGVMGTFEIAGTPDSSTLGDSLFYELVVNDNGAGITGSFTELVADFAANSVIATFLGGPLDNPSTTDTAFIEVSVLPYYETNATPGDPFSGDGPDVSGACPGDTTAFSIAVLPRLFADFTSSDTTICEDSTALLTFLGSPNTEITLFNAGQVITVPLDAIGVGEYTTPALTSTTEYFLTGISTDVQDPDCSQLFDPPTSVEITVIPAPFIDSVTVVGVDTTCTGNSKNFRIFAENADFGTAYYTLDGVVDSVTLNGGSNATVSFSTNNGGPDIDSVIFRVDSIATFGSPRCLMEFADSATLYVKPLPLGTITPANEVCNGDSVAIIFDAITFVDNPYHVRIRFPNGSLTNFTDVMNGDTVFFATTPGVYYLERLRDNRGVGGVSCTTDTDGNASDNIDSAIVVIEEEPNLRATMTNQAGVIALNNQSVFNAFNPPVCNGEFLTGVFTSDTPVSDTVTDDTLYVLIEVISDDSDNMNNILPVIGTNTYFTLPLSDLALAGNLINMDINMSETLEFILTPYFENGTDTDSLNAEECFGPPLTYNITILPEIGAQIDLQASDTEVCDGDDVTIVVVGSAGGEVEFTTSGLTGVTASPITLSGTGIGIITGTSTSTTPAEVQLTEITVMTNVSGVTKICTETLNESVLININPNPLGELFADEIILCNGEQAVVQFAVSPTLAADFADGMFTLTINDEDFTVTTVNDTGTVFMSDPLTADTTFILTSIIYNPTGCETVDSVSSMGLSSLDIFVEPEPRGEIVGLDENGMSIDTVRNGIVDTFNICTGDSLNLSIIDSTMGSGIFTTYASVTFDADLDYYGLGLMGDTAVDIHDFPSLFSARYQNLTNMVQGAFFTVTYYREDSTFMANYSGMECTGITDSFYVLISPNPIAVDLDTTICSDELLMIDLNDAITNGVVGAEFTYTTMSSDPMAIPAPPSRAVPSMDPISGSFENVSGGPVVITYTVEPTVGGCVGNNFDLEVTVLPEPGLRPSDYTATICSRDVWGPTIVDTTGLGPVDFDLVAIDLSTNSADLIPSSINAVLADGYGPDGLEDESYTNFTDTTQTATYTIVPFSVDSCYGDTTQIQFSILPEPKVDSITLEVCSGTRLDIDIIQDLVENQVGEVFRFRRFILPGAPIIVLDGNDSDDPIIFDAGGAQVMPNSSFDDTIADSLINTGTASLSVEYRIFVDDTSSCGIRNDFFLEVLIREEADASLDPVSSTDICSGDPIILVSGFTGIGTPTYTYSVASQDPDVDSVILVPSTDGSSVSVDGVGSGQATIQVDITDENGCVASATQIVNIGSTPFLQEINGPGEPCVNTLAFYTLDSITPGNTYQWALSNPSAGIFSGGVTTGPVVSITFNSSVGNGPFTLSVTETSPEGCVTVHEKILTLVQFVSSGFSFQLNFNDDPLTVAFTELASGGITGYLWDFGDGSPIETDPNPVHVFPDNPMSPGDPFSYVVSLTVVGACPPFTATFTDTVTINSAVVCDEINLVAGVNFISFDVEPTDPAAAQVFGSIVGLSQVTTWDNGPRIYTPSLGGASTLSEVDRGRGYIVIVNQDQTLQVCGIPIDPNFKLPLVENINYVGYMGVMPESADSYLDSLVGPLGGPHNLIVSQTFGNDLSPFTLNYIPDAGGVNTLTQFENGRGYYVIINNPVGSAWRQQPGSSEVHEFVWGSVSGSNFVAGDVVDIINETGDVIGELQTDESGQFRATPLFGRSNRPDGSVIDGLDIGEEVRFRYKGQVVSIGHSFAGQWRLTEIDLVFNDLSDGVSDQSASIMLELAPFEMQVSPNPAGEQASITIVNPTVGNVELLVLDVNGRVVQRILSGQELQAGTSNLQWNSVSDLPSGLYNLIVIKDGRLLSEVSTRLVKR
ncbi:MAG: PKD-like domain-containing protein [Bacteroidota bacterium]